VQAGENLFRIALKYGLSYQRLAAFNGITNPHVIRVGQEIKIPPSGEPGITPVPGEKVHVVKAGENLFRIALSYGTSYQRLADANGLSYPYLIYVGQRLIIP
jgi:LysM repeat protein